MLNFSTFPPKSMKCVSRNLRTSLGLFVKWGFEISHGAGGDSAKAEASSSTARIEMSADSRRRGMPKGVSVFLVLVDMVVLEVRPFSLELDNLPVLALRHGDDPPEPVAYRCATAFRAIL
jgi:hypothetical protein